MKIKTCQIESEFVPNPVEYAILLPKEYENSRKLREIRINIIQFEKL